MTSEHAAEIRIERNLLIPLPDGASLAADLYAPPGDGPFPTLVSYYPYHKDGLIGCMFEYARRYFAEHGYANLLVDVRGLGNSDGIAYELLDAREGEDGVEIINWAANQDWCDGNIGMWGFSYGGTTSMQTASRRPPNLKAIVPIQTLSDVYRELITRLDCMPFFGNWGALMVTMNILPPLYQDPEGRWFEIWKERLETGYPHIFAIKQHPNYDEYWKSRVIPVENIDVPTMIIGGWQDVNVHAMIQVYESITAPKKLVQGPWTHIMPYHAPIEQWDYLHDMKLWWDRWLKGEQNSVDDEPAVKMFVQGSNTWRNEPEWPIQRTEHQTLHVNGDWSLSQDAPASEAVIPYLGDPTVGAMAGLWDGTGLGIGTPLEQSEDDTRSLTFTTEPLDQDMEITGSPEAVLHVELESGDDVNLVAKLCVVAPDGNSHMVTVGSIKGSTYDSDEHPTPLETGKPYEFKIPLFHTSYHVPSGYRLRLSVSCSDFPRLWPTETNPLIKLYAGGEKNSSICIPTVPIGTDPLPPATIRRPDPNISDGPLAIDGMPHWSIKRDIIEDRLFVTMGATQKTFLPAGGTFEMDVSVTASVSRNNPEGTRIEGGSKIEVNLPSSGTTQVESKTILYKNFIDLDGKATLNGKKIFEKSWRI